jgi:gamma-glutamylcyclotransferase (GGCT)/AIG2-like uncharacterized protein YtfP
MDSALQPVFVYGTLCRQGSNHFRMAGAEWIGSGSVTGRLYRIDWYPGLVLDAAAGDEVHGELFAVSSALLAELDLFEGLAAGELAGSEYRRVKVDVRLHSGETQLAWVWEWIGPTDERARLFHGNWLKVE